MTSTVLTEMLGIKHPLLLAPMGGVAGGELAAAVSAAGGLGLIGSDYGDADRLAREIDRAGSQRFGIGFITWVLHEYPALLEQALASSPSAIMFSFGDCRPFIPKVHAAGVPVICQVRSVAEARQVADAGADIIVAQGTESGGHGGLRSTFTLVPAVVDAVGSIPVVAAGGVVDGRGIAAACMLGAAGVLMGTRFFASEQALGTAATKQALVSNGGDDTLRTRVFDIVRGHDWPHQITGRAVANTFARTWHGHEDALAKHLETEQARYRRAEAADDTGTTVVFAGEGLDSIDGIEPAEAIVERLMTEVERLLGRGGG